MSKMNINIVGEYSYSNKEDATPACFYYSIGNVVIIFDYNKKCAQYFINNPEILRNARKIIFCFSSYLSYDKNELRKSELVIHLASRIKGITCPIHIMKPNIDDPNSYGKSVLIRRNGGWVKVISNSVTGASVINTNSSQLMIKPCGVYVDRGFLTYTVWACEFGIWEMKFFYNGLSGELDLNSVLGLMRSPNTKLIYYINHLKTKEKDLDNKKVKERLVNTFDDLKNSVILLGFKDKVEREYLVGDLSKL